jgi:uncharacterized protein
MFRTLSIGLVIAASFFVLFTLGDLSISSKAVPSLSEYISSTTPTTASTSIQSLFSADPLGLSVFETIDTPEEFTIPLKTPAGIFRALVASTSEQMERGLSFRELLPDDRGMLFFFATTTRPGFWMKDMSFPLDIIWVNTQKKVVGIHRNIAPATFPDLFYPASKIKYVLEINAGMSDAWGIATGTILYF